MHILVFTYIVSIDMASIGYVLLFVDKYERYYEVQVNIPNLLAVS